jgi:hypothetical protein
MPMMWTLSHPGRRRRRASQPVPAAPAATIAISSRCQSRPRRSSAIVAAVVATATIAAA